MRILNEATQFRFAKDANTLGMISRGDSPRILERHVGACILMLTGSNSREDVDRARQAGAAGYVTKDRIAAELVEAILEVAAR